MRKITMQGRSIEADIDNMKRISIGDVLTVETYSISKKDNRIMHHIIFNTKSSVEITILLTGDGLATLEVFQTHGGAGVILSDDGVVTLYASHEALRSAIQGTE